MDNTPSFIKLKEEIANVAGEHTESVYKILVGAMWVNAFAEKVDSWKHIRKSIPWAEVSKAIPDIQKKMDYMHTILRAKANGFDKDITNLEEHKSDIIQALHRDLNKVFSVGILQLDPEEVISQDVPEEWLEAARSLSEKSDVMKQLLDDVEKEKQD